MTTFKDIYPQDILDLIDNEDFNNTELKSPMIKPQQIADILGITYNEDLYPWAEFDTDARQIVPHTQDDFITNRRKDMRSIAYILLKTPTNYKSIISTNRQTRINMYDRAASQVADKLLMPEKLPKRLIKEQLVPQYTVIEYTNPKTDVKETGVREYENSDYYIMQRVAEILQVTYNQLEYRLQSLGIISR
jgi:hypothetical protein